MNRSTIFSARLLLIGTIIFFLVVGLTVTTRSHPAQSAEQSKFQLVRVQFDDYGELNHLITTFDVWEIDTKSESVILLADEKLVPYLYENGWSITLEPELTEFHLGVDRARAMETFFGGYKNNDEIIAELEAINAEFPELTELVDYGDSLCKILNGCETPGGDPLPGRDLLALRITNEAITGTSVISGSEIISGSKPVFVIQAGIHSRELSVQETSSRFARWMLENYTTDPALKPIIDWQETWIVPVANPDGYDVVYLGTQMILINGPLLHRKNGRVTQGCAWPSSVSSHFGVDLNRNFSFGWGPIGTSANPCSQVFNGAGPASEPEIEAFEELVRSLIADQRGPDREDAAPDDVNGFTVSMHSFSEVIIYPWGDGLFPDTAPNADGIVAIANRLGDITGYQPVQGNDFSSVSGASDDHFYGELGIPSFTFELGTTFLQDYGYTSTTIWNEVSPALLYSASLARAPYQLIDGPELSGLATSVIDNQLIITGTVSDAENGNNTIVSVTLQTEAPHPLETTLTVQGSATDGTFDTSVEQFEIGPIDLSQLAGCMVDVYLHGTDENGAAGPASGFTLDTGNCPNPTPTPSPTPIATPEPPLTSTLIYLPAIYNEILVDPADN